MDDRWAWPLLIGIPLLVVGAYLLAWKSKQRMVRASATSALIVIIGIAMFWISSEAINMATYYVNFRHEPLWHWIVFEGVGVSILALLSVVAFRMARKVIYRHN